MNSKKLIRKILLIILFAWCVNTYAAVIGDLSGKAFITKEEFENLKTYFNDQIDNYNNSLTEKIDGTIASYIVGTRLMAPTTKPLLIADWEEYTVFGGEVKNQWAYPNINANYSYIKYTYSGGISRTFVTFFTMNYANSKTSNRRILVDNIGISETIDVSDATWAGIAYNCTENWTLNRSDDLSSGGEEPVWLRYDTTNNLKVCKPLNITARGFIDDFNVLTSNYWGLQFRWEYNESSGGTMKYAAWPENHPTSSAITPEISYDTNAAGKDIGYKHIGAWQRNMTLECTAKDVTNYLAVSPNNNLKTSGWLSEVTSKEGQWSGMEAQSDVMVGQKASQALQWTDNDNEGNVNNADIPTIGLIGDISASNIYQYKKLFNEDGLELTRLTLNEGAPLFYLKENESVEWTANFSNCLVGNDPTQQEVTLVFSSAPFTDKVAVPESKNIIKVESGGLKNLTKVTTTNRKVKLTFQAEDEGVVYCKWYPAVADAVRDSENWEATLDLTKSKSYISTLN